MTVVTDKARKTLEETGARIVKLRPRPTTCRLAMKWVVRRTRTGKRVWGGPLTNGSPSTAPARRLLVSSPLPLWVGTYRPRQVKALSGPSRLPLRPHPSSLMMIRRLLPVPPVRLLLVPLRRQLPLRLGALRVDTQVTMRLPPPLLRQLPLRLGALRVDTQVTMWLPSSLRRQLPLRLGALRVCGALQVTMRLPSRVRASASEDAGRVPVNPPAGRFGRDRGRRRTMRFVSAAV